MEICGMEKQVFIFMAKAIHHDQEVWLLKFPNENMLREKILKVGHIKWSKTKHCWYGVGTDEFISGIRAIDGVQVLVRKYTPDIQIEKQSEKQSRLLSGESEKQRESKRESSTQTSDSTNSHQQKWEPPKIYIAKSRLNKGKKKTIAPTKAELPIAAQKDLKSWKEFLETMQYAPRSIQVYATALREFLLWIGDVHHKEVKKEHVNDYMQYLVKEKGVSRSYQNQHVNAIKSFYKHTFSIHLSSDMVVRPRKEYKLPHYLTREEVTKIFNSIGNIKHRSMVCLVYACGLRLGEVLRLRLCDIDAAQRLLLIRQSKGNKDRVVPLPESILMQLNDYAMVFKPKIFLFEGQISGDPYSERSMQQVFKNAVRRSGIRQTDASLHWLRHSYATHLLEMGTNVRDLQTLLGHKSLKTTEGYTHISSTKFKHIVSPFDVLPNEIAQGKDPDTPKKLYF